MWFASLQSTMIGVLVLIIELYGLSLLSFGWRRGTSGFTEFS